VNLLEAMDDPKLFAGDFPGESWTAWRVMLRVLFGLPLSDADWTTFNHCTGRQNPPADPCREGWIICGRRSGKSRISGLIAVYLACFRSYKLARGERGVVLVLAADRRQARVVFRYIRGLLSSPLLEKRIQRETADIIELEGGVSIEVATASHRTIRGYTVVAAVLDEIAFWRSDESASPDTEIVNALRPAMANVEGAILLALSSPYARKGVLWKQHTRHYGRDGDPVLCWQAATATMNPALPTDIIASAYLEDESAARAEWGAEFRADLEDLFDFEAITRCVVPDRAELPPAPDLRYRAFVDPSGGRRDSFTLGIAHKDGERCVVDAVRAWKPPFNPSGVVSECAAFLKEYRVVKVTGDRFAGEWPREAFRSEGVRYELAPKTKSELYLSLVSFVHSERIEIPDNETLLRELRSLERRRGTSGKDRVDHPPGGHDDLANALAGVAEMILGRGVSITWEDCLTDSEQKFCVSREGLPLRRAAASQSKVSSGPSRFLLLTGKGHQPPHSLSFRPRPQKRI